MVPNSDEVLNTNVSIIKTLNEKSPTISSNVEKISPSEKTASLSSSSEIARDDKPVEISNGSSSGYDHNSTALNPLNLRKIRPVYENKYQKISVEKSKEETPLLELDPSLSNTEYNQEKMVNKKAKKVNASHSNFTGIENNANSEEGKADDKNIPLRKMQFNSPTNPNESMGLSIEGQQKSPHNSAGISKSKSSPVLNTDNSDFNHGNNLVQKINEDEVKTQFGHIVSGMTKKNATLKPSSSVESFYNNESDTPNQINSNSIIDQKKNTLEKKIISVTPRYSLDDIYIDSSIQSSSTQSYVESKKRTMTISESSITVNRLDIKIVGDSRISNQKRGYMKGVDDDNYDDDNYSSTRGMDNDSYDAKSLNKSYLWRCKIKL